MDLSAQEIDNISERFMVNFKIFRMMKPYLINFY
jgi:hypothetical protein